jgi:hypothetical protein
MTVAVVAACNSDVADPVVKRQRAIRRRQRLPPRHRSRTSNFQVEKVGAPVGARLATQVSPTYSGRPTSVAWCWLSFVVDTNGEWSLGTFKALKSDHALFTQAVSDALPDMRFDPAYVALKKVRQLVQQPFTFALSK